MSTSSNAAPWRVADATFVEIEIRHPACETNGISIGKKPDES